MGKYIIKTLQVAPSMMTDDVEFIGEYVDAVKAAHAAWQLTGRTVRLCTGTTTWHHVSSKGEARDFNTNSGVPSEQKLLRRLSVEHEDGENGFLILSWHTHCGRRAFEFVKTMSGGFVFVGYGNGAPETIDAPSDAVKLQMLQA